MPPSPYSDHSQGPNSLNFTGPFRENDSFQHQPQAATSQQQETTVKPKKVHMPKELKFCSEVLNELIAVDHRDCASSFFESANTGFRLASNFDEVIKHPMDLVTVKNKLENGKYKTATEFAADVRLIFSNCYKFYGQGFSINPAAYAYGLRIQMARKLQHVFEIEFAKMPGTFPESDDDCEERDKGSGQRLSAQQPQQELPQQTEVPVHQASMPQPLSAAEPHIIKIITRKIGSLNLDAQTPKETNMCCVASKSSSGIGDSKKGGKAHLKAQQTQQQVPQQFQAPTVETDMTEYLKEEQNQMHTPDDNMPTETNMFCASSKSCSSTGDCKRSGEAQQTQQLVLENYQYLTCEAERKKQSENFWKHYEDCFQADNKLTEKPTQMKVQTPTHLLMTAETENAQLNKIVSQVHQQYHARTHKTDLTDSANAELDEITEERLRIHNQKDAKMPRDTNRFCVYSKSRSGSGDSKEGGEARFRAKQTRQQFPRPYMPQVTKINYAEVAQQFKAPTHENDMALSVNSEEQEEFDELCRKYFKDDLMPTETNTFSASSESSIGTGDVEAPHQPIDMTQSSNAEQPNPHDGPFHFICSDAKMPRDNNTFGVYYKSSSGTGEGSEAQKTLQRVPQQFQAPTHKTDLTDYERYWQIIEQKNEYESGIRKALQKYSQRLNDMEFSKMSEELLRAQSIQQQVPASTHPIRMAHSTSAEQPNAYKYIYNHPLLPTSNFTGSNSSNTVSPFAGTSSFPRLDYPSRENVDRELRNIINYRGNLQVPPTSSYSNSLNPGSLLSSTTRAHPFALPSRELEERASTIFQRHVVRMVMRHVFSETGRYPETLEHLSDEILMYKGIKPNPAAVSSNNNMCKLCFVNPISTVFEPCGHRVTCKECAMYYATSINRYVR